MNDHPHQRRFWEAKTIIAGLALLVAIVSLYVSSCLACKQAHRNDTLHEAEIYQELLAAVSELNLLYEFNLLESRQDLWIAARVRFENAALDYFYNLKPNEIAAFIEKTSSSQGSSQAGGDAKSLLTFGLIALRVASNTRHYVTEGKNGFNGIWIRNFRPTFASSTNSSGYVLKPPLAELPSGTGGISGPIQLVIDDINRIMKEIHDEGAHALKKKHGCWWCAF